MTINGIIVALIARLKSQMPPMINANQIYEGVRKENIVFPCLLVELGRNHVDEYSYPYEKISQFFKIGVFVQEYDKDHQLTNSNDGRLGLGSLIDAVKKALTQDSTLGQNDIIDVLIPDTDPANRNYPIRDFTMTVQVKYRQNRLTRL